MGRFIVQSLSTILLWLGLFCNLVLWSLFLLGALVFSPILWILQIYEQRQWNKRP